MTTTIVFGDAADGAVVSSVTGAYSTARAGNALVADNSTATLTAQPGGGGTVTGVGQRHLVNTFFIGEGFIAFDLDAADIPEGDAIIDVDLALHQVAGTDASAYDIEARAYDWGASLTTSDWVPGADLGDHTLLATLAASTQSNTLRTFTAAATALVDHVDTNRAGTSRMLLNSSRHRTGNAPATDTSVNEHTTFSSANATGTTNDPRLVIEHEEVAPPEGSILEVFDGDTWQPLTLEVFDGDTWQPLNLERITP